MDQRIFLAYHYRIEAEQNANANEAILRVLLGRGWVVEATYGDAGNGSANVL